MMKTYADNIIENHWSGDSCLAAKNQNGIIARQIKNRVTLKFSIDKNDFYLKRYTSSTWRMLLRICSFAKLQFAEAQPELRALRKLQHIGISAPIPVAWGCGRDTSFLVTRALPKSISLETYMANWNEHPPSEDHRRALLNAIADTTRVLHSCGINHRDLYLCHYYLCASSSKKSPKLYLLDLHRAQLRPYVPRSKRIKDLGALYSSAHHLHITKREGLRFIRRYHKIPLNKLSTLEWKLWAKIARRTERNWVRNIYKRMLPKGANGPFISLAAEVLNERDLLASIQDQSALPSAPFVCELHDDRAKRQRFHMQTVLAHQPPHHIVLQANWQGKPVVLKIFSLNTQRGKRRWQRTVRGSKYLQTHKIPTPQLLNAWTTARGQMGIAVFKHLISTRPACLEDFEHILRLIRDLAKHYLVHVDAHPNNFIWAGKILYIVDTDGIRRKFSPWTRNYHMAKLFVRCLPIRLQEQTAKKHRMNGKLIARIRRKRFLAGGIKAYYQANKGCQSMQHKGYTIVYRRDAVDPSLIEWLKRMDWHDNAVPLKLGSRSSVWRIQYQQQLLVVKHYFPRGFWYALKHLLRVSHAQRYWRNANSLLRYTEIQTPKPVALIEKGKYLWRESWVITQYCSGPMLDKLSSYKDLPTKIDGEIQNFFASLELLGVCHGDTKASNFIVAQAGLFVLDLDSMHAMHSLSRHRKDRDRLRFLRNFDQQYAIRQHYKRLLFPVKRTS